VQVLVNTTEPGDPGPTLVSPIDVTLTEPPEFVVHGDTDGDAVDDVIGVPAGGPEAVSQITTLLSRFRVCLADFDGNGFVNGDDFDLFSGAVGLGDAAADVNFDGFVNGDDFDYFTQHFDAGC
jgi:hypothetical protein